MAKQQKKQDAKPVAPVEKLGLRISEMINSPKAQDLRRVTIHRLDTDTDEAWEQVMELLSETDGIDMVFNDDGTVTLKWEEREGSDGQVESQSEYMTTYRVKMRGG
ncbi:TPA: DUF1654 domain-containing protein [Pseudomonas aeruginosa]|uniref:DUF1654 domain-containing protein n=1 Tax=Pseudomonas aeruginosa TaxID=287 RepID=UPI000E3BEDB9|nr:DUF1654 domain-containing protein [Pseudomonas aeruginosa]MCC0273528.1 DUF1654 domain-containing protein [Pseudomonas aeruginosa]MCT5882810.1 DUF1654 domain-containing protein [Pseudomonas aeruginosa]MDG3921275.1 DUF1654 domain-containing protein [Pseudomonas aeruginosa]MDG4010317.1 DUF1654 domain-containing protein [Pseudomonas aeruginosa]MDG4096527.1 DUF1654 domain-containing protein [Pseudomonas aeruginosa]